MLDRRTVVLADGSVRSYFSLPPDYQDFTPERRPIVDPSGRFPPYGPGGGHGPGSEGFRDRDDPFARPRPHDYWNSLGLDGRVGAGEGSLKRKYGDDDDGKGFREDRDGGRDDFSRRRLQPEAMANGFLFGPGGLAGTSSPYRRELMDPSRDDGMRSANIMRGSGGDFGNVAVGVKHHDVDVDQVALKKAFLHYSKIINESALQRKAYLEEEGKQGHLQCLACGRSSKEFPDMHGLIMHIYNFENADLRVDHLGLHKALCVLKGWNYLRPPDNSMVYRFLPPNEATDNRDDLIMWPPLVIIHNTSTGKGKDGRTEGYGNKAMDLELRDLGFVAGKSKSLYSKEGHLGVTLVKFSRDMSGLKEAMRLAEFFERENHGRRGWEHVRSKSFGKDDDRNPNLVQVDEKTGKRKKIFYGYLGTASDLADLDSETRKKTAIESRREIKSSN